MGELRELEPHAEEASARLAKALAEERQLSASSRKELAAAKQSLEKERD